MNFSNEQYTELLALTQLYLVQEFPKDSYVIAHPDLLAYFKRTAGHLLQKKTTHTQITPSVVAPNPPPKITPKVIKPTEQQQVIPEAAAPTVSKPDPIVPVSLPRTATAGILELEPLDSIPACEFSDIRSFFSSKLPSHVILDHIPSDEKARQLRDAWRQQQLPKIIFILPEARSAYQDFLDNIAKAIQQRGATVSFVVGTHIEREKGWVELRKTNQLALIILCDRSMLSNLSELANAYQEYPGDLVGSLFSIPCIILDAPLYFKEPQRKAGLWHSICRFVSKK